MGESHVRGLVSEGAKVLIGDVLDDEGHELASELGAPARYSHLDVSQASEWTSAVRAAEDWAGPVDVLVNNVGIIIYGGVEGQEPEEFRRMIEVNLVGTFLGMRAVLPSMRSRCRGAIVNIASVSGLVGFAGGIGYAASKFGIRGLTKAAALDVAGTGIPAAPDRRAGGSDARLVLFLASDDASIAPAPNSSLTAAWSAGGPNLQKRPNPRRGRRRRIVSPT